MPPPSECSHLAARFQRLAIPDGYNKIEGMFRDVNDYAELTHNGSTWFLSVGSGQFGVGLREKAISVACLNKDQR